MASEWSERDVQFFTVYVREPHAGGQYPQPKTLQERTRYAKDCVASDRQQIPVIIDAIDNGIHATYGGLPNMVYVIDTRGKIGYRASWAKHDQVRDAVDLLLRFHEAKQASKPVMGGMPAWSEQALPPDPDDGVGGVIRAIEVWEQAENYDEPERFLGEKVAEVFRRAYKTATGKESVRPS